MQVVIKKSAFRCVFFDFYSFFRIGFVY